MQDLVKEGRMHPFIGGRKREEERKREEGREREGGRRKEPNAEQLIELIFLFSKTFSASV